MDSDEAPRSDSPQSGARNWYTARTPVAPSRRNWYARHEPAADPASSADRPAPQAAPDPAVAAARGELATIDAAGPVETNHGLNGIDRAYAADLQRLQQQFNQLYQFSRLYDAQLGAKDQQLAELGRRMAETERERDALKARAAELERRPGVEAEELRRLYDAQLGAKDQQLAELGQRVEDTEQERDALKARAVDSERERDDLKARAMELKRQPATAVPATNGADQARHPQAPAAAVPEATNSASPATAASE